MELEPLVVPLSLGLYNAFPSFPVDDEILAELKITFLSQLREIRKAPEERASIHENPLGQEDLLNDP